MLVSLSQRSSLIFTLGSLASIHTAIMIYVVRSTPAVSLMNSSCVMRLNAGGISTVLQLIKTVLCAETSAKEKTHQVLLSKFYLIFSKKCFSEKCTLNKGQCKGMPRFLKLKIKSSDVVSVP